MGLPHFWILKAETPTLFVLDYLFKEVFIAMSLWKMESSLSLIQKTDLFIV